MSRGYSVEVGARAFTRALTLPGLTLEPLMLSWAAMGGCERAEIRATGGELALWSVANLLRCPVLVRDGHGEEIWWGYVSDARIQVGRWLMEVSLDSMANRIAVAYEQVEEGQDQAGTRATTDYAEDAASILEYGTFERLEPLTYATLDTAEDYRDRCLLDQRFPIPALSYTSSSAMEATLTCRGWWQSLQYVYYTNPDGDLLSTTELAQDILNTAGQFLAGYDGGTVAQHWASELDDNDVPEYRDGDTNALAEIEELLRQGSDGRRVLPAVSSSRMVYFERERSYSGAAEIVVDAEARLASSLGSPLVPGPGIVGRWCRTNDVIPAAASMVALADPTRLWIERAELDCASGALRSEGRGASAWELGGYAIR